MTASSVVYIHSATAISRLGTRRILGFLESTFLALYTSVRLHWSFIPLLLLLNMSRPTQREATDLNCSKHRTSVHYSSPPFPTILISPVLVSTLLFFFFFLLVLPLFFLFSLLSGLRFLLHFSLLLLRMSGFPIFTLRSLLLFLLFIVLPFSSFQPLHSLLLSLLFLLCPQFLQSFLLPRPSTFHLLFSSSSFSVSPFLLFLLRLQFVCFLFFFLFLPLHLLFSYSFVSLTPFLPLTSSLPPLPSTLLSILPVTSVFFLLLLPLINMSFNS